MDDHVFIDEYPAIDKAKDARRDFLADEKILMYELQPGDVVLPVTNSAFEELYKQLNDKFEKFGKELGTIGYLSGNSLVKTINEVFGTEIPETLYETEQGFLSIDEWIGFEDAFTGSEELLEKMEPAEPVYDISWIRKRMKCCKNPMERKQLEKQLNEAYKARKKARKKNEAINNTP